MVKIKDKSQKIKVGNVKIKDSVKGYFCLLSFYFYLFPFVLFFLSFIFLLLSSFLSLNYFKVSIRIINIKELVDPENRIQFLVANIFYIMRKPNGHIDK